MDSNKCTLQHRALPELPENALCAFGNSRELSGIIGHFRALPWRVARGEWGVVNGPWRVAR
eukprot:1899129-Alexandrium_andersonii.AAC.1